MRHRQGLWTIVEFQHVKPGKGGEFVRTKLKKIPEGAVVDNASTDGSVELVREKFGTVVVLDERIVTKRYGRGFIQALPEIDLADVDPGQAAAVIDLAPACRGVERRRLMDLGIVPGTRITAELRAAGGGGRVAGPVPGRRRGHRDSRRSRASGR